MSFGFSIGDFITIGKLISDITNSLKDAGGAKSEYQGLLRELECLNNALQRLDKLQLSRSSSSDSLDSIKYAALSCHRPLEEFLAKIRIYEKSLGLWAKPKFVKGTAEKLKWSFGFGKRDEIAKLQSYLNVHVGTINILMMEHGLKALDVAAETAEVDQLRIHERLQETRNIINNIKDNVNAQKSAVAANTSMLAKLYQMISGELSTSLRSLSDLIARVCVSTQQIYGVVLDIRSSLPSPDTRWAFFQAPLLIEDALGCRYPVPSEYSFELLDEIIKLRFKIGPGSQDVKFGNYELFKTTDNEQVITANTRLLPGTSITMAIIVARPVRTGEHCPMPHCASDRSLPAPGGGRLCCECSVSFSPSTKKRRYIEYLEELPNDTDEDPFELVESNYKNERRPKRAKSSLVQNSFETLKNVRYSEQEIFRRGGLASPHRCYACHRTETIQWHSGPEGPRTLCNACGLHFLKLISKSDCNRRDFEFRNVVPVEKRFEYILQDL